VQCTKSAQRGELFIDFMATGRAIAEPAGGVTEPAVGVPVYTQSAF
jgi:hypothetical protein